MAVAPDAPRGGTPAARHEQRPGFAGRREKQEAGLTPDRAGRAGKQTEHPISGRPSREEGYTPQEQERPTPAKAEEDLPPPSRRAIPRERTSAIPQKRRT